MRRSSAIHGASRQSGACGFNDLMARPWQTKGQRRRIFGTRGIVKHRVLRHEDDLEQEQKLMKLSRRGAVEPFHAMDVLAEM
jgi:hypothetical protein